MATVEPAAQTLEHQRRPGLYAQRNLIIAHDGECVGIRALAATEHAAIQLSANSNRSDAAAQFAWVPVLDAPGRERD